MFAAVINGQCGKIISSDGRVAASIDSYTPVTLNGELLYAQVGKSQIP